MQPSPSSAALSDASATAEAEQPRAPSIRPVHDAFNRVSPSTLSSHNEVVTWRPELAFRPESFDELSRVIAHVAKHHPLMKIKAGGTRNSYTAPATDGAYIHPEGMAFVRALQPSDALRADVAQPEQLFRVGGGTTLREMNARLWEAGYSLSALGGFDGQTLAGAVATGTHGSVLQRPSLAGLVCSIDMVDGQGRKKRIEPQGGPTDAAAWHATDIELVQDDATFNAALVSVGMTGVVYSYMLRVEPRFYLKEVRTVSTIAEVKRVLAEGHVYRVAADASQGFSGHPAGTEHLDVLFNPYSDRAVITTRSRTTLEREPRDLSQRQDLNIFKSWTLGKRFTRPIATTWITDAAPRLVGKVLDLTAKTFPGILPAMNDASLASLKDEGYTQRSYNVFNVGDGANALPGQSAEFFVPLRGDMFLRAIDVLREAAKEWAAARGEYQTGPIAIRFVKGSPLPLLPSEDYATFEALCGGHSTYAADLLAHYKQALVAAFGIDVWFHWGQATPGVDATDVTSRYPKYDEWRGIRDAMDPERRFMNASQESLFLAKA